MDSKIAVGIFFAIFVVVYDYFVTLKMGRDELRRQDEITRQSKGDGTSKTTGEEG